MRFPAGLSIDTFLRRNWQKLPLNLPAAIDNPEPILDSGELAWLATMPDVESRLVFTETKDGVTTYRVESGPFDEEYLSQLPQQDWTLLVQDVEKHLPDFRQWFAQIPFVPDWRIDDLMISFAAPGGSVGPHSDNYDVFLCQTEGVREWRLANPGEVESSDASEQLALLQPFESDDIVNASRGDVLYIPPTVPHWGIAVDACMTYSIGMRAPSVDELRLTYDRLEFDEPNPFPVEDAECRFFTDGDVSPTRALPGEISSDAVARCESLTIEEANVGLLELAATLGCTVTDLKPWLDPEPEDPDEIETDNSSPCRVHGMARLAWWSGGEDLLIFANGRYRHCETDFISTFQSICERRTVSLEALSGGDHSDHLRWLIEAGAFDLHPESE